ERCPVCQQVVHELPSHHGDVEAELASLRAVVQVRRGARDAADKEHRAAERAFTEARTRHDHTVARLAGLPERAVLEARIVEIDRANAALDELRILFRDAEATLATLEH